MLAGLNRIAAGLVEVVLEEIEMIKVLLDYDPTTGMIYHNGAFLITRMGIPEHVETKAKLSIAEIIKLKEAGFTADEVVILAKEGVV